MFRPNSAESSDPNYFHRELVKIKLVLSRTFLLLSTATLLSTGKSVNENLMNNFLKLLLNDYYVDVDVPLGKIFKRCTSILKNHLRHSVEILYTLKLPASTKSATNPAKHIHSLSFTTLSRSADVISISGVFKFQKRKGIITIFCGAAKEKKSEILGRDHLFSC